jgi:hypothetical protein
MAFELPMRALRATPGTVLIGSSRSTPVSRRSPSPQRERRQSSRRSGVRRLRPLDQRDLSGSEPHEAVHREALSQCDLSPQKEDSVDWPR